MDFKRFRELNNEILEKQKYMKRMFNELRNDLRIAYNRSSEEVIFDIYHTKLFPMKMTIISVKRSIYDLTVMETINIVNGILEKHGFECMDVTKKPWKSGDDCYTMEFKIRPLK